MREGRKDGGVIFDVMEKEKESVSKSGRKVERKILMTRRMVRGY